MAFSNASFHCLATDSCALDKAGKEKSKTISEVKILHFISGRFLNEKRIGNQRGVFAIAPCSISSDESDVQCDLIFCLRIQLNESAGRVGGLQKCRFDLFFADVYTKGRNPKAKVRQRNKNLFLLPHFYLKTKPILIFRRWEDSSEKNLVS
jgi:hypothetical protein